MCHASERPQLWWHKISIQTFCLQQMGQTKEAMAGRWAVELQTSKQATVGGVTVIHNDPAPMKNLCPHWVLLACHRSLTPVTKTTRYTLTTTAGIHTKTQRRVPLHICLCSVFHFYNKFKLMPQFLCGKTVNIWEKKKFTAWAMTLVNLSSLLQ